ncbi:cyclase family protein [Actinomadura livida]|uniref:Cyclase family protein n=1 Tax=Actinomadura livida TaxID=79909 RepID=A0A7W7MZD9_9ACTN|nr:MULTISPECIES: cyclase family protein [Actinomadura]MBB4775939.1 kynurenine formamidase [Actinomadura catellatispora]GGU16628.1 cyclase [Actinomadura livida]
MGGHPNPDGAPGSAPRPRYRDLPDGRAAGVFGAGDVLGTLNLQTPDAVVAAARLVRSGRVFALNAPVDWPDPPLYSRLPVEHTVFRTAMGNLDDHLDHFYPQASSQWDGFRHIRDPEFGYYNGQDEALGVDHWARRGIAGRGVLLDVGRALAGTGRDLAWNVRTEITAADLERARAAAGVDRRPGDVLLVRTGWTAGYEAATTAERTEYRSGGESPGLEPSREMAEYLWDWGVGAVASDNVGVEALPAPATSLHHLTLSRLGLPLGELWWLEALAEDCLRDGRYEHLLVSAPLHVRGGIGSPANAVAIK